MRAKCLSVLEFNSGENPVSKRMRKTRIVSLLAACFTFPDRGIKGAFSCGAVNSCR
jgi:hypothetical protein